MKTEKAQRTQLHISSSAYSSLLMPLSSVFPVKTFVPSDARELFEKSAVGERTVCGLRGSVRPRLPPSHGHVRRRSMPTRRRSRRHHEAKRTQVQEEDHASKRASKRGHGRPRKLAAQPHFLSTSLLKNGEMKTCLRCSHEGNSTKLYRIIFPSCTLQRLVDE